MTLIADVFPKSWTPKHVVRYLFEKSRFRRPLQKQHCKLAETLLTISIITEKGIELEKFSLRDMQNLKINCLRNKFYFL